MFMMQNLPSWPTQLFTSSLGRYSCGIQIPPYISIKLSNMDKCIYSVEEKQNSINEKRNITENASKH